MMMMMMMMMVLIWCCSWCGIPIFHHFRKDFLGRLGGAWSPQKVTALSAKEGASQYLEAQFWWRQGQYTSRAKMFLALCYRVVDFFGGDRCRQSWRLNDTP